MKFLIMVQGNQAEYDAISSGRTTDGNRWAPEDLAAMYAHMESLNNDLAESGEWVDGHGLAEPKQARLVTSKDGVPVISDGPYGETKEVVAGFWVVECDSIDRATEIAARAYECPLPSWSPAPLPIIVHPIDDAPEAAGA